MRIHVLLSSWSCRAVVTATLYCAGGGSGRSASSRGYGGAFSLVDWNANVQVTHVYMHVRLTLGHNVTFVTGKLSP